MDQYDSGWTAHLYTRMHNPTLGSTLGLMFRDVRGGGARTVLDSLLMFDLMYTLVFVPRDPPCGAEETETKDVATPRPPPPPPPVEIKVVRAVYPAGEVLHMEAMKYGVWAWRGEHQRGGGVALCAMHGSVIVTAAVPGTLILFGGFCGIIDQRALVVEPAVLVPPIPINWGRQDGWGGQLPWEHTTESRYIQWRPFETAEGECLILRVGTASQYLCIPDVVTVAVCSGALGRVKRASGGGADALDPLPIDAGGQRAWWGARVAPVGTRPPLDPDVFCMLPTPIRGLEQEAVMTMVPPPKKPET
jgi:hypothetical protein